MSAGLLDAIFATATVAAGVDFPARTVIEGLASFFGKQQTRVHFMRRAGGNDSQHQASPPEHFEMQPRATARRASGTPY